MKMWTADSASLGACAHATDALTPAGPGPSFRNATPSYIDFGCGAGASLKLAQSICGVMGGGVGIDISAEQVAAAERDGFDVVQGDMLAFEGRGVAPAAFAVDVMPELDGRAAFDTACVNVVRAARDFAVFQHPCFDSAEVLASRGLVVPGHTDKRVRMRPRAMDYLHFVMQYAGRLDIVGFAAFGFGEPKTKVAPITGVTGSLLLHGAHMQTHRSIRVVIARKEEGRFHVALDRAGKGEMLMTWRAP